MRLLPSVIAALGLLACGPPSFVTTVKGGGVVTGSLLGGMLASFPALGGLAALDFDDNQDFKNQGVTRAMVGSVKVESLTLAITEPTDQDFSFLDSVQVAAKSSDLETLVAEKNEIAALPLYAPNPSLALDLVDPELGPHLAAPQLTLLLRGKGRLPPRDTRLEAKARLRVFLKP